MKLKEWTRSPTTKSHELEFMGVNEPEIQIPEKNEYQENWILW